MQQRPTKKVQAQQQQYTYRRGTSNSAFMQVHPAAVDQEQKTTATSTMSSPPPYDEATKGTFLSPAIDAPPAYDQIFGISDLKEAKRESSNHATFAVKFCEVISGTIACAVCMILLSALPITMIVIGSVYFDDCEDRRTIPIWLIVFGCVSVVQSVIDICKRCFRKKKDNEEGQNTGQYVNRSGSCVESTLSFFLFVWIIIGSVWVFGYYGEFQDCRHEGDSVPCCHPVPYLFSFVTLVLIYSVSLLICCCCCCMFCCTILIGGAVE